MTEFTTRLAQNVLYPRILQNEEKNYSCFSWNGLSHSETRLKVALVANQKCLSQRSESLAKSQKSRWQTGEWSRFTFRRLEAASSLTSGRNQQDHKIRWRRSLFPTLFEVRLLLPRPFFLSRRLYRQTSTA